MAKVPLGLLYPITPPTMFKKISLDFLANVSAYNGQFVIMVVIDRFSKVAHFGT